jgi:hypothetical protein
MDRPSPSRGDRHDRGERDDGSDTDEKEPAPMSAAMRKFRPHGRPR